MLRNTLYLLGIFFGLLRLQLTQLLWEVGQLLKLLEQLQKICKVTLLLSFLFFLFPSFAFAGQDARVYYLTDYVNSTTIRNRYVIYDPTHKGLDCLVVDETFNSSGSVSGVTAAGNNFSEAACLQSLPYSSENNKFASLNFRRENTFGIALFIWAWTDFVSFGFFCLAIFAFVKMIPS